MKEYPATHLYTPKKKKKAMLWSTWSITRLPQKGLHLLSALMGVTVCATFLSHQLPSLSISVRSIFEIFLIHARFSSSLKETGICGSNQKHLLTHVKADGRVTLTTRLLSMLLDIGTHTYVWVQFLRFDIGCLKNYLLFISLKLLDIFWYHCVSA